MFMFCIGHDTPFHLSLFPRTNRVTCSFSLGMGRSRSLQSTYCLYVHVRLFRMHLTSFPTIHYLHNEPFFVFFFFFYPTSEKEGENNIHEKEKEVYSPLIITMHNTIRQSFKFVGRRKRKGGEWANVPSDRDEIYVFVLFGIGRFGRE